MKRLMYWGVLLCLLVAAFQPMSTAAALSMTNTAKTSLDKTAAAASPTISQKLKNGWNELSALQVKDGQIEASVDSQHYRNAEALSAAKKQIKLIDAAKIAQLTAQVDTAKKKYEPLFNSYSALTQQVNLARQLGSKELTAILRAQQDAMKAAVALARADIRNKQAALTAAKESLAKKTKTIRTTLEAIEPLETKIKAVKSTMKVPKKNLTTSWSNFTSAARKTDAASTLAALTLCISLSGQINASKQQILGYEQQIAQVITRANAQIKAA
ncbi:archaellum component FlaC [Paenibacillus phyllosphaerae]|uniref:Archaellum component FlaC n=1 Tax=Paenibacillus phyllosphaerae TaxID=274593 RepID=A0A7W5FPG8_9BACL|nr:hypothetical protein [Paenibacillus phyllosphaerae]MBB3112330.1 archaellum component FlaC [Paenibacillus phyllosphaerae]